MQIEQDRKQILVELEEKINDSILFRMNKKHPDYELEKIILCNHVADYQKAYRRNIDNIGLEIVEAFEKVIKSYKPDKGLFTHYYNKALSNMIKDAMEYEEEETEHNDNKLISLNMKIGEEGTTELIDMISSSEKSVEEKLISRENVTDIVEIINCKYEVQRKDVQQNLRKPLTYKMYQVLKHSEEYKEILTSFKFFDSEVFSLCEENEKFSQKELAEYCNTGEGQISRTIKRFLCAISELIILKGENKQRGKNV